MEHTGLRLLEQSRKGLARVLFSRTGFVSLILLLNALLLVSFHRYLRDLLPPILLPALMTLFVITMTLYLLNSSMDPSAKLTWLLLMAIAPTVGTPLYFYVQADWGHRKMKERVLQRMEATKHSLSQGESSLLRLKQEAPEELPLLRYLQNCGCHPLYDGCRLRYFSSGEEKFAALKEELEKAQESIFMEYFIVDEGKMWGELLEILARKAADGVTVRLMYDGSCEFTTLTRDYPQRLRKLGIDCKVFAPATPLVSTHYNYRDHRKIAVIDGKVAFTGGVNLADEYINAITKYGHWKDAALMVEGEAAQSFGLMFRQLWALSEKETAALPAAGAPRFEEEKGFVVPFSDCPLDRWRVGERVYMDILNRAQNYVHIMTPYLIPDGELEAALCFAAERGVDVKLILPGIPDKRSPYALAKTYYGVLLDAGVEIYEYEPGFVHSKVFVSDDCRGVVGTINLDYRSLYHHFECAAYLRDCGCLADMEADVQQTLASCRRITSADLRRRPLGQKLLGWTLRGIAPLF